MTEARGSEVDRTEVSWMGTVAFLLSRRRTPVTLAVASVIVVVAISLLPPREYTSRVIFLPQAREDPSFRLTGLAAQLGFELPVSRSGPSPEFYAALLRTRQLLASAATSRYTVDVESGDAGGSSASRAVDLLSLLEVDGGTRSERVDRAVERLKEMVEVGADVTTGMVDFSVSTRWPAVSQQVASRLVDLINEFNLETRRSQAAAERSFLEERIEVARSRLLALEDSLRRFLEENRRYENSPALRFEHQRLTRRVELQQEVYGSLARSYERARMEEVRDTPVITVVDPAERPVEADSRHLVLKTVLALVLGGAIGVLFVLAEAAVLAARQRDPGGFDRLRDVSRSTLSDLWRPWIALRRRRGGE